MATKKRKKQEQGYYNLQNILPEQENYNFVIGKRSNSEMYSVLLCWLDFYIIFRKGKYGNQKKKKTRTGIL